MSQDYYGRSTWSFVNDDLNDDDAHRCTSYATWSELHSQDVNEDLLSQNNHSNVYNFGLSAIRNPSPPIPEPEFTPSISDSTKGFIEQTYRYERRRQEDIVGRPDEYYQYCPPPPQLLSDSDSYEQSNLFDSQSTVTNIRPTTPPSYWSFAWYSLSALAIGIIFYYVKDFPFVEWKNIF